MPYCAHGDLWGCHIQVFLSCAIGAPCLIAYILQCRAMKTYSQTHDSTPLPPLTKWMYITGVGICISEVLGILVVFGSTTSNSRLEYIFIVIGSLGLNIVSSISVYTFCMIACGTASNVYRAEGSPFDPRSFAGMHVIGILFMMISLVCSIVGLSLNITGAEGIRGLFCLISHLISMFCLKYYWVRFFRFLVKGSIKSMQFGTINAGKKKMIQVFMGFLIGNIFVSGAYGFFCA